MATIQHPSAILVVLLATAASLPAAAPLVPCPELVGAQCGVLTVFENRAAGSGRTLDLDVVVFPARSTPEQAPIVFLLGGPGEAATDIAPFVADSPFSALLEHRALVLVDQRGTGGSHRLQCPQPPTAQGHFGHVLDPAGVQACREALAQKADLRLYTTSLAIDDLDDLRGWLGYDKVVVWGGSYGTRAAMEYLRRHGGHAEAAILDAVAPFDALMPLYYAYDAQRALDRVIGSCEDDPGCAAAYPTMDDDFAAVLDLFRKGPVRTSIRPAEDASPVAVDYSLGDFGYTIRGMLYNPRQTARLPRLLAAARATGDVSAFAQAYFNRSVALGDAVANGLYLSVLCAEDVPFIEEGDVFRWTAGTYLGPYLVDDYREACTRWARGAIAAGYHEPIRTKVPTLVFSGGRDPVTSPRWGDRVVEHLVNGRHIVFPDGGHGVTGTPCGIRLIEAFLGGAHPHELDLACTTEAESRVEFEIPEPSGG